MLMREPVRAQLPERDPHSILLAPLVRIAAEHSRQLLERQERRMLREEDREGRGYEHIGILKPPSR